MEWIALITLFLQIFGPIFAKLIDRWLNKAAKKLKAPTAYASPAKATEALYDAAIAEARGIRHAPIRALLRAAKRAAVARAEPVFAKAGGANVKIPPLTKAEKEEMTDLHQTAA